MSDIPRYSANPLWFPWCFVDNPSGKFCEYRDYVKLQAENGRLRHEQKMRAIPFEAQLFDRLQELKSENERLQKELELEKENKRRQYEARVEMGKKIQFWSDDRVRIIKELSDLYSENERLRSASFVTAVPADQYERVIKAGDAMARCIQPPAHGPGEYESEYDAWFAAKEGRDAK